VRRKPEQRRHHHLIVEYERAGQHDNQYDERHDHDEFGYNQPDHDYGPPLDDHDDHDDDRASQHHHHGRHRPAAALRC
jgi:hypothetical protein